MEVRMKVLNKHRDGVPKEAVYIGRPSKWGNPFAMSEYGSRAAVVEKYRRYLWSNKELLAQLPELYGKDLVCYCAPHACHGDVLLKAAAWHKSQIEEVT
jgi:hypothetical protein